MLIKSYSPASCHPHSLSSPGQTCLGIVVKVMHNCCIAGTVRQLILKQMQNAHSRVYTHEDCLRWSTDIARALVYLHSGAAGSLILHRDINPDNIMLTKPLPSQADAKLVDFGLHKSIPGSILTTQDCTLHGMLKNSTKLCNTFHTSRLDLHSLASFS